jgi:uncharacterized protein (DUF1697 family)
MTAFVAVLRAVNVGGRKLIMTELKGIADKLGLADARTFIASGNLLFRSGHSETSVKAMLEKALGEHMGAEVSVMVRTTAEMAAVVKANPFPDGPQAKVAAIFLDGAPSHDTLNDAKNVANERMALGTREIYVAYPDGMGQSKLRIPAAKAGTARNMNTVAKLAELLKEME